MQNGLYVATSGLLMQQQKMDVISNNLANVNTVSFKKELALFNEYHPVDKRIPQNMIQRTLYNKTINSTVLLEDIHTDFSQGPFRYTDNSFDFAIEDPHSFFSIETPFGLRFTRDGAFSLNERGELVTQDGFNVLTTTGSPVMVPQGTSSFQITREGNIYLDDALVGQLNMVTFNDLTYLQKSGRNLYTAVSTLPEVSENPGVRQGLLEMGNVEPVMEMVRMIEALRAFEMQQKVVHTYDSMNEISANQIAKI